jgi:enoyl-CoA hydratase
MPKGSNDRPGVGRITLSATGPVRRLTISNPGRKNAISLSMHEELSEIWQRIAADDSVRAVVLTGEGNDFSAGGEVEMLSEISHEETVRRKVLREAELILSEMVRFPLPLVSAIKGAAVGLGASLAIAADVVLIGESGYLADPHVAVGIVAGDGGAALWPVLTNSLRTREYLYTGDRIMAKAAVEVGLATRMVPDDDLLDEAHRVADRLAALPRDAFELTKQAANLPLLNSIRGVTPFAVLGESVTFQGADVRQWLERFGGGSGETRESATRGREFAEEESSYLLPTTESDHSRRKS